MGNPYIESLDDLFRPLIEAGIDNLLKDGIPYVVTAGFRTVEEQFALWRQGRDDILYVYARHSFVPGLYPNLILKRSIVTRCDGLVVPSMHNKRLAVDICPATSFGNPYWPAADSQLWQVIADRFQNEHITWGGSWKDFPDPSHYEYKA